MRGVNRDLGLARDPARRHLPWLLAMIVYVAAVAVAGMMSFAGAIDRWDTGLTGTATVQVPPLPAARADDGSMKARVATAIAVLDRAPGVLSSRPLTPEETSALLEPWLGKNLDAADLPLPRLIDVRLRTRAAPDMDGLQAMLSEAVPGAQIDDHREQLGRLVTFARTVELIALAVVGLVALAAVVTVVFITRTGLAIHAAAIELLHLLGARDGYVARQFQHQALEICLKGGAVGLVLAAATAWAVETVSARIGGGLLPHFTLAPLQWLVLPAVPVAVALIGIATARITVVKALRRLP